MMNATTESIQIPPRVTAVLPTPEFIRLPPPGSRCPFTGLSRSAINQWILPCPANGFKPLVKSFVIRQKGAKTGIRLVDYSSLMTFIRSHTEPTAAN